MSEPDTLQALQKIFLVRTGASTHVHHDDVVVPQRGQQHLLHVDAEAFAIDWTFEQPGRGQLPRGAQPRSGATFVLIQLSLMKNEGRIDAILVIDPLRPPAGDVRTIARQPPRFFEAELIVVD